jgi:hypothetical protein
VKPPEKIDPSSNVAKGGLKFIQKLIHTFKPLNRWFFLFPKSIPMRRIFTGSDSDKLVFWRKVYFYFNIVGLCSIVAANVFKKHLLPYRTILLIYLPTLLLIWVVAMIMIFVLKRKINSN